MSDDPETARQIAELARDTRPLVVLDVDDVILEFVRPFVGFLDTRGLDLKLETFRLNGNIIDRKASLPVENEVVASLIDDFFHAQAQWQTAAEGAVDAIAELSREAEIVMLTAMPHRHRAIRRAHLDRLGFPYPLLDDGDSQGPGDPASCAASISAPLPSSMTFRTILFRCALRSPMRIFFI